MGGQFNHTTGGRTLERQVERDVVVVWDNVPPCTLLIYVTADLTAAVMIRAENSRQCTIVLQ